MKNTPIKIQFNTDRSISGAEELVHQYITQIAEGLDRYGSHITRIIVHISDENGNKEGVNDIRCLLEARLEGRQPIAVSNQADTIEQSVSGAIEKLQASLKTILGRISNH